MLVYALITLIACVSHLDAVILRGKCFEDPIISNFNATKVKFVLKKYIKFLQFL